MVYSMKASPHADDTQVMQNTSDIDQTLIQIKTKDSSTLPIPITSPE